MFEKHLLIKAKFELDDEVEFEGFWLTTLEEWEAYKEKWSKHIEKEGSETIYFCSDDDREDMQFYIGDMEDFDDCFEVVEITGIESKIVKEALKLDEDGTYGWFPEYPGKADEKEEAA